MESARRNATWDRDQEFAGTRKSEATIEDSAMGNIVRSNPLGELARFVPFRDIEYFGDTAVKDLTVQ